jgi:hypothetical protein
VPGFTARIIRKESDMRRQFGEMVKERSYEQIVAADLPTLQRRVYNVLVDITPSQFDFIMANDFPKLNFNNRRIDQDTHYIICSALKDLLDCPRLLLTNDDLFCAFQRFKELLFLKEGIKQGIIREEVNDKSGITTYWTDLLPDVPRNTASKSTVRVRNRTEATCKVWRIEYES